MKIMIQKVITVILLKVINDNRGKRYDIVIRDIKFAQKLINLI